MTSSPPAFAAEGQQVIVAALAAALPREAVGQDAALEQGAEVIFDESRQLGTGADLGVRYEAG